MLQSEVARDQQKLTPNIRMTVEKISKKSNNQQKGNLLCDIDENTLKLLSLGYSVTAVLREGL